MVVFTLLLNRVHDFANCMFHLNRGTDSERVKAASHVRRKNSTRKSMCEPGPRLCSCLHCPSSHILFLVLMLNACIVPVN